MSNIYLRLIFGSHFNKSIAIFFYLITCILMDSQVFYFNSKFKLFCYYHAFFSYVDVLLIYAVCVLIDLVMIWLIYIYSSYLP